MLTDDQKARRKNGIGGSDAAAVLGYSPYQTAVTVFLEKTGQYEEPLKNAESVHWGSLLEPLVLDEYERITGNTAQRHLDTLIHPEHPWMFAHLDGRVPEKQLVVECKTSSAFMRDWWGEAGTDKVPPHYIIQVQHYMAVTGDTQADIAVLIGGNEFKIYSIKRDEEIINHLIRELKHFWEEHVCKGIPPEATQKSDAKLLWPHENELSVEACNADLIVVDKIKAIRTEIKSLEAEKAACETQIMKQLGEASALIADEQKIATWRSNKNGQRILRVS